MTPSYTREHHHLRTRTITRILPNLTHAWLPMPDALLGDTPPFLTSNPSYTHKRQSPTCDTAPMPASVLRRHRQPSSFPRARWEQRLAPRRATCLSPPLLKLHILNHTDLSSPPNTSNSPPNYTLHSLTIVPSSLHEYTR